MTIEPAAMRHFACTRCGMCCNRSPEVELSEAAALADVFVFLLTFRLVWMPQQLGDYVALKPRGPNAAAVFHQKKRLLETIAARTYAVKLSSGGKPVRYSKHLVLSALAVDSGTGACGALTEKGCGIYERRPLSCRSVPFHYSRVEAEAERSLQAFVEVPGYRCDSSESAPRVLQSGKIVHPEFAAARAKAAAVAKGDRSWSEAIVRRMKGGTSLPTLEEIERNAHFAATTVSMAVAWRIAVDAGLMARDECHGLISRQLKLIDRELANGSSSADGREMLDRMRATCRQELNGGTAIELIA